jgi:hypothetical protein
VGPFETGPAQISITSIDDLLVGLKAKSKCIGILELAAHGNPLGISLGSQKITKDNAIAVGIKLRKSVPFSNPCWIILTV